MTTQFDGNVRVLVNGNTNMGALEPVILSPWAAAGLGRVWAAAGAYDRPAIGAPADFHSTRIIRPEAARGVDVGGYGDGGNGLIARWNAIFPAVDGRPMVGYHANAVDGDWLSLRIPRAWFYQADGAPRPRHVVLRRLQGLLLVLAHVQRGPARAVMATDAETRKRFTVAEIVAHHAAALAEDPDNDEIPRSVAHDVNRLSAWACGPMGLVMDERAKLPITVPGSTAPGKALRYALKGCAVWMGVDKGDALDTYAGIKTGPQARITQALLAVLVPAMLDRGWDRDDLLACDIAQDHVDLTP